MKRYFCLTALIFAFGNLAFAQDEGVIEKKERFERDKGIFISLGPSFTLGKNIGDYSTGFNFEAGYYKRMNRVLSIGPSLSVLQFNYDPEKTGFNNAFVETGLYDAEFDAFYNLGMIIDFTGGDLTLTSLALNLKFNFVPVSDQTRFSVYGFAKPFLSFVSRSEVNGTASVYTQYENEADWFLEGEVPWEAQDPFWASMGVNISDKLEAETEVSGGIFIGPGVELNPAKNISVFAQAAFGYTFPVTFVSTEAYEGNTFDVLTEEFPMVKKGFPSVNIQFGGSYNF